VASNRVFVANLNYALTEDELRSLFLAVGGVEKVDMVRDHYDNKPKGFAFITMMTAEDAERAVEKFHGTELQGRRLRVEIATGEPKDNRDRRRDERGDRREVRGR